MSYTSAFSDMNFRLISLLIAIAIMLTVAFTASAPVRAAEVATESSGIENSIAPEQQAQVSGPDSNLEFLFAVFIITWAAFFGYIFYLSRRQREMRKEIDALTRALDDRERRMIEAESGSE